MNPPDSLRGFDMHIVDEVRVGDVGSIVAIDGERREVVFFTMTEDDLGSSRPVSGRISDA